MDMKECSGKKRRTKAAIMGASLCLCLTLCGCEDMEWFEHPESTELSGSSYEQLEEKTYYIKEGTKFYKVMTPDAQEGKIKVAKADASRVVPVYGKDDLIPIYYKDSFIAYKESSDVLEDIVLERLYDRGWSFGVKSLKFDERGYLTFNSNSGTNLVKESSFGRQISEANLKEVRIVSIDGKEVTPDIVDLDAGVILGLEKDKEYEVEIFHGTSYGKIKVKADVHMLQSYEVYSFDNTHIDFTQKNYMQFKMPEDMKPGYYLINGAGIFLYTGVQRGEELNIGLNEENDNQFKIDISQAYSVLLETKMRNIEIVIQYNNNSEANVRGIIKSPTGQEYDLIDNAENKTLSIELDEASAGEWQVKIYDATAKVSDISVNDTTDAEETTMMLQTLTFDEDESNVTVNVPVNSTGNDPVLYGYVFAPDGRVYDLELVYDKTKETGKLTYTFPFASKGTYQLKIYYLVEETDVMTAELIHNEEEDTDVIHIED